MAYKLHIKPVYVARSLTEYSQRDWSKLKPTYCLLTLPMA